VKQNLKLSNSRCSHIALVLLAFMLATSACATRARNASSEEQFKPATERASLININTATPAELEKLPGIGKATAERIVAQREQHGPFRRPEHLMMVRGISDRKFREIRSMIVVE
jgi:competence protein ComEA